MSRTKKGFLYAGTILAIIEAVFILIFGLILAGAPQVVNLQFMKDIIAEAEINYEFTDEQLLELIPTIKTALVVSSVAVLGMGTAILVIAIKLLHATRLDVYSRKLNITLLVLAAIVGDILTLGFMITVLCIKSKPKTEANSDVTTIEV